MTVSTEQPSSRPRPEPSHVYVVVDLGGTQTRTAIFDPTGQMPDPPSHRHPPHGRPR
jgi:predicted NBD/HSP70 family sugar kinase